jgi:hypothetical protein
MMGDSHHDAQHINVSCLALQLAYVWEQQQDTQQAKARVAGLPSAKAELQVAGGVAQDMHVLRLRSGAVWCMQCLDCDNPS